MRMLRPMTLSIFCARFCSMAIPLVPAGSCPPRHGSYVSSKILPKLRRRYIRFALEVERRHEPSVLVHQVDDGGMIHRVVAAVERHLLVVDAILLGDRSECGGVAGQAAQVRVEASQIVLERRRGVAL